jgi:hypothetical protein
MHELTIQGLGRLIQGGLRPWDKLVGLADFVVSGAIERLMLALYTTIMTLSAQRRRAAGK